MKLTNIEQVTDFLDKTRICKGDVWLTSPEGDKINLKSSLSQYVAIGELLSEKGEYLELFCADTEDEKHFIDFFDAHPETL